jgi:SAM-dependent methyltransferase
VSFDPKSRSKLTPRDLPRFSENTLFHRIGRAVCEADCLPRKELFEAWEVARRTRRRFRGGRVLDLACGHGLLAHLLLLLDDSSPEALAIDARLPASAAKIAESLVGHWPRLSGRVKWVEAPMATVAARAGDLLVSCHACGKLSDDVLTKAIAAQARVVILPCCHEEGQQDEGGLGGWLDSALAIDVTRAARLERAGYAVHTQLIPATITPKNRLLLAEPKPERSTRPSSA